MKPDVAQRTKLYSRSGELHHLLGHDFVDGDDDLDGARLLAQHQEALLALAPRCVDAPTHPDRLLSDRTLQLPHGDEIPLEVLLRRLDQLVVAVLADGNVFASIVGVLSVFRRLRRFVFSFLESCTRIAKCFFLIKTLISPSLLSQPLRRASWLLSSIAARWLLHLPRPFLIRIKRNQTDKNF